LEGVTQMQTTSVHTPSRQSYGDSICGRPAAFEKAYRAWSAGWICRNERIGNLSKSPFDCPGVAELRAAPMSMR
jgi:hypothetical protein